MSKDDAPGQNKSVEIYINTIKFTVEGPTVTFEEIVELAYPNSNFMFSVSFSGGKGGKEGNLLQGKRVPVESDMMFDVTPTDKS